MAMRVAWCSVALLWLGCAHRSAVGQPTPQEVHATAQFVGSTPAGDLVRTFIGGFASNAPCHSITWKLAFGTNQEASRPATFRLSALYHIPTAENTNRSQDGPTVEFSGTVETTRADGWWPGSKMHRLRATHPERSIALLTVGENLLQVLNPDGSLMVGNGGESYTLNRAARAEAPVERELAMTVPDMSYRISPLATGPAVFGVFEGRTPCQGIAHDLKIPCPASCMKAKWRVTLYRAAGETNLARYKIEGTLFRPSPREGTWKIVRGRLNPNANVYQLDVNQPDGRPLFLMKGDDNVLFFLNQSQELLTGHIDFSYTLNRVAAR